jgi:hypothetical protein
MLGALILKGETPCWLRRAEYLAYPALVTIMFIDYKPALL